MTRSKVLLGRATFHLPARNGFSLLELVIALTIGSVLVLLAVGLINKAFELRSAAIFRVELSSKLDQVSRQFRKAARLSEAAVVSEDTSELLFEMADGATQVFKYDGTTLRVSVGTTDSDSRQVLLEAMLNSGQTRNRFCKFSVEAQTATFSVETRAAKPGGKKRTQVDSAYAGDADELADKTSLPVKVERVVSSRIGRWRSEVSGTDDEGLRDKNAEEGESDE